MVVTRKISGPVQFLLLVSESKDKSNEGPPTRCGDDSITDTTYLSTVLRLIKGTPPPLPSFFFLRL